MALLLTLPPELRAMVATFLDFNSLLALSKSAPCLKQFRPDFQTFSATKSMFWSCFIMKEFPVFFPVAELVLSFTCLDSQLHTILMTLVAYTDEDGKEKSEETILVDCSKRVLVIEGKSEEIVFKVGLSGSEGASMMLVLKPYFEEVTVTVVSSLDPNRKVKNAIPPVARRLGAQFYVCKPDSRLRE